MAKFTVISFILVDCVPMFFLYSTSFKEILGGQSVSKNSQIYKVPKLTHPDPDNVLVVISNS